MDVKDLPALELVGKASDFKALTQLICQADGGNEAIFTHFDILRGGPRSGRLLLKSVFRFNQEPLFVEAAPITPPMGAEELAAEFLSKHFLSQVRFDPGQALEPGLKKGWERGWEVYSLSFGGLPAVVLWSAWVPEV